MFSISSRYQGIPTAVCRLPDGRKVNYVLRRFLPRPEELVQVGEHVVAPGERLDVIAAREFGDAEQSWQIADANRAMDPDELAVTGRRLRIAQSAGVPKGRFPLALPGAPANGTGGGHGGGYGGGYGNG
jgi:hypothetical protein